MPRVLRNMLTLLLIAALSLGLQVAFAAGPAQPPMSGPGGPPPDVPGASDWARAEIQRGWSLGLTTQPILSDFQQPITREEFCEIAVLLYERISNQLAEPVSPNPFVDTANPAILKAFALGITNGVSPTQFAPGNRITRQEISCMLVRVLRAAEPGLDTRVTGVGPFADQNLIASWALQEVQFCNRYDIMRGVGGNKIDPRGNTTREQAICLVVRMYDAAGNSIAGFTPSVRHVILSVALVTTEWMPYTDVTGWTGAVPFKESYGVKFYEVAVWEETQTIQLYAFPNSYYPCDWRMDLSETEQVAYRESFCIEKFAGMPAERSERGPFMLNAFTEIARILVQRHPNASHNFIFTGHGTAGIGFIEGQLNLTQSSALLSAWRSMLGRKLGFVDMGGPCLMGSFQDLEAYYEHADYYIATDLMSGCTVLDEWAGDNYERSDPLYNYPRLLWSYNFEDALIERVNVIGTRFELSRNDATTRQLMQSHYLYSCGKFGEHKDAISSFMRAQTLGVGYWDIVDIMRRNGASQNLLDAFAEIILHGVDTKDFFAWPEEHNGMIWLDLGAP